jgi:hypothetical protein
MGVNGKTKFSLRGNEGATTGANRNSVHPQISGRIIRDAEQLLR